MWQITRRISRSLSCLATTLLVMLLVTSAQTHDIEIRKGTNDNSPFLAGTPSDGTVLLSAKIQEIAGIVVRAPEPSRYRHKKKPPPHNGQSQNLPAAGHGVFLTARSFPSTGWKKAKPTALPPAPHTKSRPPVPAVCD